MIDSYQSGAQPPLRRVTPYDNLTYGDAFILAKAKLDAIRSWFDGSSKDEQFEPVVRQLCGDLQSLAIVIGEKAPR